MSSLCYELWGHNNTHVLLEEGRGSEVYAAIRHGDTIIVMFCYFCLLIDFANL